jgi:hypothetical protein
MDKIILNDEVTSTLRGLREQVEVCDAAGQARGVFLPWEQYERLMYDWLRTQITDAEIAKLAQQPRTGKPLKEIWKQLGRV